MLIEGIRGATAEQHQLLESKLFPFLQNMRSVEDYIHLLNVFYGYMQPVQTLISGHIDRALLPDIDRRRNAGYILQDLEALGSSFSGEICNDLPAVNSNASAFGALYVMEGSTLGGKIIANMVSEKLGIETGLLFFRGYGPQTRNMWKEFTHKLENDRNAREAGTIISGALQTFFFFGIWLEKHMENIQSNKQ